MRKNAILITSAIVLLSSCATYSDVNPELYPTSIPSHVRYSQPSETECLVAKQLLEKALQNETKTPVGLFEDVVVICHRLWSELKSKEPYKNDPGARAVLVVDGVIQEGKAFKIRESMDALELYLRDKLNNDGPVTIRPPNRPDLTKYWAVIAWDIETPLFVAENNKLSIIFDFDYSDGSFWNVVLLK